MLKTKRNNEQLEKDITSVLARMGELIQEHSVPRVKSIENGYGATAEFERKWTSPQAENTYNNYVKILAKLNEEKMQNGNR